MKIILGVVVVLAVVLAAAFVYALSLPETRSVTREAEIGAPPEVVYDLAIDAENQPSWRSGMQGVTMGEDGKSWTEHTAQGDVSFRITAEDRPQTFSLEFASAQGFSGEWTGVFAESGAGTTMTLTEKVAVKNPVFRLISRVFKFTDKFMDVYIGELKAEAEKRAG